MNPRRDRRDWATESIEHGVNNRYAIIPRELFWHLVEAKYSDSYSKITINQAHSIVWSERRHQRLWPLESLFGSWRFPEFPTNTWKIPHPMPKFWWVPLPGEQPNPRSRQNIFRVPDSRTVSWSNPRYQEYSPDPVWTVYTWTAWINTFIKDFKLR